MGLKEARIEINIVAIVHNLKKIWVARLKGSENYVIFEFLELIVGRARLLCAPNGTKWSENAMGVEAIAEKVRRSPPHNFIETIKPLSIFNKKL